MYVFFCLSSRSDICVKYKNFLIVITLFARVINVFVGNWLMPLNFIEFVETKI